MKRNMVGVWINPRQKRSIGCTRFKSGRTKSSLRAIFVQNDVNDVRYLAILFNKNVLVDSYENFKRLQDGLVQLRITVS